MILAAFVCATSLRLASSFGTGNYLADAEGSQELVASIPQTLSVLSQDAAALADELQLLDAAQGGAAPSAMLPPQPQQFLPQQLPQVYMQPQFEPQPQPQPQMMQAPQEHRVPQHKDHSSGMSLAQVMTHPILTMGAGPGLVAAQLAVARGGGHIADQAVKSVQTAGLLQMVSKVEKSSGAGDCGGSGELKCTSWNKFRTLNYRLSGTTELCTFWGFFGVLIALSFVFCCCCLYRMVTTLIYFGVIALIIGIAAVCLFK